MRTDHLPCFLKPTLRLFLSVDLVNSTALKQRGDFPIPDPDQAANGIDAPWKVQIADFYRQFAIVFAQQWVTVAQTEGLGQSLGERPARWKCNGDELIYVKPLKSTLDASLSVLCWLRALRAYRQQLRQEKRDLDVKGTAWLAGFPIANTEVVLLDDESEDTANTSAIEPNLLHYMRLNQWYSLASESRRGLSLDFMGPSIDIGFRLSARSSARKFMVSVEAALLLSSSQKYPGDREIVVRYDGREVLKGVVGGQPYPLFWIDTFAGDALGELDVAEDEMRGGRKGLTVEEITTFCQSFIRQHDSFLLPPYIVGCADPIVSKPPPNYEKLINRLHTRWLSEETRRRNQLSATEGASPEDDKAMRGGGSSERPVRPDEFDGLI